MLKKCQTHPRNRHNCKYAVPQSMPMARTQSQTVTSGNLHACPPLKVGMGSKWISLTRSLTGW
jgi:hypothetical protein